MNQYERGVILTLGKFSGTKEPGLRLVVPVFQKMRKIDVRSTLPKLPCVTSWVRMRAADALEKICRQRPEWLLP